MTLIWFCVFRGLRWIVLLSIVKKSLNRLIVIKNPIEEIWQGFLCLSTNKFVNQLIQHNCWCIYLNRKFLVIYLAYCIFSFPSFFYLRRKIDFGKKFFLYFVVNYFLRKPFHSIIQSLPPNSKFLLLIRHFIISNGKPKLFHTCWVLGRVKLTKKFE